DNGIGIPAEEQRHLFEKFYRTSTGRRTTGGTGLGLTIARSIVDLHGGRIWCDSDGESGSTFTFTLPRRRI
ncbi:MAG: ATP-binding protein, partial [Dehalococcoidia bacterium]|nr:ATP-binding protein [Dehalococcoidia bacterium]